MRTMPLRHGKQGQDPFQKKKQTRSSCLRDDIMTGNFKNAEQ